MSAREWMMQGVDFVTGDMRIGPGARVGRRFTGSGMWFVAAWGYGRALQEEGVPDSAEAQSLASEWLDRREAEAQRRAPAALKGTPAQAPGPAPEAFALGAMERASLDELAPKFHALKAGETLAVLVTRREDGLAHVVWGPAKPLGTPASSGEPPVTGKEVQP